MSKILLNIPTTEREDGRTQDAIKYGKHCDDFQCMEDGTIIQECKYCNLSLECRQIDILPNGEAVPMEANFLQTYDPVDDMLENKLFCTGMYDLRPLNERAEDDKVS